MNTINFYLLSKLVNPEPVIANHSNHSVGEVLTFSNSFDWIEGGKYKITGAKTFKDKSHQDLEIIKIDS